MGCWNETCALSNLPITVGDRVRFLILLNTGAAGKSYYYNDNYIPLCLPISGEYDDYGAVENIEVDEMTALLLQSQKFYIVDEDDKEIKDEKIESLSSTLKHWGCSNISFVAMNSILNLKEYDFTTIEEFVRDVSRDTVFYEYGGKYYLLQLIMYHESLYDTLVSNFQVRVPYDKKENLYELWCKKIKKYYEGRKEYMVLRKIPEDDLSKEQLSKLIHYEFQEPVFKTSQYGYNFVKWYEKYISDEDFDKFVKLLVDYIMFSYCLSYGRNGYYAVSGLGSQGQERKIQMLIAEWILEYCRSLEDEREHYDDEDDDCDPNEETVFWWDEK